MERWTRRWPNVDRRGQRIVVSPNRRYLMYEDGSPFFYLADTAWQMFQRLDLESARHYLADRAAKGFTAIQAAILAELDPFAPNANGDVPLIGDDPTRPNEAYFAHVDAVVQMANRLGLRMALLPCWGSYSVDDAPNRVLFPENGRAYGEFLGRRYRDSDAIWVLGGDRNAVEPRDRDTVAAIAAGLGAGDGGRHLKTYHPCGPGHSSRMFHDADWLDFNMIQSSHAAHGFDNGSMVAHDRGLEPPKPTLDGEPRYEGIPAGFYFRGYHPADRMDDFDARNAGYWAVLAGACGHTYGHNCIWQMAMPGVPPVIDAHVPWYEAIHHPGSRQMGYLRRLFETRPVSRLVPAQDILIHPPLSVHGPVRAARADDGSFVVVYAPVGEPVTVDLNAMSGRRIAQGWFDPRNGAYTPIHTGVRGTLTFTPPNSGRGRDWVLVLDDADAGLPTPGNCPA
ncbi:MAG: glycoside hydrolase family 140 protein [Fimbriimonadaceae bacterium]